MANPSISIPDELLDDFDDILKVEAMLGERKNDDRSPLIRQWIREYVAENEEYLRRRDELIQGNLSVAMTAD